MGKAQKLAAVFHVAFGIFGSLALLFLLMVTAGAGSMHGSRGFMPWGGIVAGFGLFQVIAGLFCLQGSKGAKYILIAYSVPLLVVFPPISTALSVYTLLAFARGNKPLTEPQADQNSLPAKE